VEEIDDEDIGSQFRASVALQTWLERQFHEKVENLFHCFITAPWDQSICSILKEIDRSPTGPHVL
jgi:hypothetical protein